MRHSPTLRIGIQAFRRRAASLAVAYALAAAGTAQAFEIDTGNEDITMRWDRWGVIYFQDHFLRGEEHHVSQDNTRGGTRVAVQHRGFGRGIARGGQAARHHAHCSRC